MTPVDFGDGKNMRIGYLGIPIKEYDSHISTQWKPSIWEAIVLLFGGRVHIDSGKIFETDGETCFAVVVNRKGWAI